MCIRKKEGSMMMNEKIFYKCLIFTLYGEKFACKHAPPLVTHLQQQTKKVSQWSKILRTTSSLCGEGKTNHMTFEFELLYHSRIAVRINSFFFFNLLMLNFRDYESMKVTDLYFILFPIICANLDEHLFLISTAKHKLNRETNKRTRNKFTGVNSLSLTSSYITI